MIGNKADLIEKRAVTYEEAMAYAKERNLNYVELSAKTGKNVALAFQTIVEEIYKISNKGEVEQRKAGVSVLGKGKNPKKKKKCC